MVIYAGSRYEGVEPLRDEEGNPYFGREIPPSLSTDYVAYYTVDGDRIDSLAHRFLGDALRWWEIAQINPELTSFENLPPNTRVRIPRDLSR